MEVEGWVVVTNGKKFRLRHIRTGQWYTEKGCDPLFGVPYGSIKSWDNEEEARAVAENNTWRPV